MAKFFGKERAKEPTQTALKEKSPVRPPVYY